MSTVSLIVGGVLEDRARVRAVITGTQARLAVDTDPAFGTPTFYGPVPADARGVVALEATGLTASMQYYYAVEDGTLDTTTTGKFRTHPPLGSPATITFAVASCARGANYPGTGVDLLQADRVSQHPVFTTIGNSDPDFIVHQGDWAYCNPGDNAFGIAATTENYRHIVDDVLKQDVQHQLYRNVPLVYTYDDHDFGPNNSNGSHAGKYNMAQVYRERYPSYDLPVNDAVYHHFQVARTLYVCLDTRFWRSDQTAPDNADKTMLGPNQKAWLQDVLTAYADVATFLVVLSPTPWMQFSNDTWAGYTTEQAELASMFAATGWRDRMVMINGDTHSLSMDTGAGNASHTGIADSTFPVGVFGSLDSILDPAHPATTEQYDTGPSQVGSGQWGSVTVDDQGDVITVTMTGHDGPVGENVWRTHTFFVGTGTGLPRLRDMTVSYDPALSRVRVRSDEVTPYVDVRDTFDRSEVGGWGTSSTGNVWAVDDDPKLSPATIAGTSATSTTFGITLTVPLPATWQPGDLAFAAFSVNDNAVGITATPTAQGWTPVDASPRQTIDMQQGLWWRVLQAGDADPSITIAASFKISGGCMTVHGHDPTAPIAAIGQPGLRIALGSNVTTAPGVTATHAEQLVIGYWSEQASSTTTVDVPGMTQHVFEPTGGGGSVSVGFFTEVIAAAGDTGSRTATYDTSSDTGYGIMLAVQSAAPAPDTADFSVAFGTGQVRVDDIEHRRFTATADQFGDVEFTLDMHPPVATGTGAISAAAVARYVDRENFYMANVFWQTDGTGDLFLFKRTGNSFTQLAVLSDVVDTYDGTSWYRMRVSCQGPLLRARVWDREESEPTAWQVTASDSDHPIGGIGTHTNLGTGNTNGVAVVEYDNVTRVLPPPVLVTVDRSADEVTWKTVRGAESVAVYPGEILRVDDYEFPPDVLLTYRMTVRDESGTLLQTETAQITPTIGDAVWLKSIARPYLNQTITVVEYSDVERAARAGVFQVVGRSTPVAITDVRGSRNCTLTVATETLDDADDFDRVLTNGEPVYVQVPPDCPVPGMYAVIGDVVRSRKSLRGSRRYFELPLTEVSAPAGTVVGGTINYEGIRRRFATYGDLDAAVSSYGSMTELVGDAGDVVL